MKFSSSFYGKAAAVAVALAAAGTATVAQARSNVYFSVGANVAPGVTLGVSNGYYPGPVYYQPPVYVRPAPVYYYEPAPVYYNAAPVYYAPPVYVRPRHWRHGHHRPAVQYGYGYRY
jgi:hypothetical protein